MGLARGRGPVRCLKPVLRPQRSWVLGSGRLRGTRDQCFTSHEMITVKQAQLPGVSCQLGQMLQGVPVVPG